AFMPDTAGDLLAVINDTGAIEVVSIDKKMTVASQASWSGLTTFSAASNTKVLVIGDKLGHLHVFRNIDPSIPADQRSTIRTIGQVSSLKIDEIALDESRQIAYSVDAVGRVMAIPYLGNGKPIVIGKQGDEFQAAKSRMHVIFLPAYHELWVT